jgi:hypothetical protein
MTKHRIAVWVLCFLLPSVAGSEATATSAEACFARNAPQPDSVRAIRMTARGRDGEKTVVVLRMYGRRSPDGLGNLFIRLEQPKEVSGTALLVLEQPQGESEIYLATPEMPTARRISGPTRADGMFQTDFSSEDLQRLQQGWRPGEGELKLLPEARVAERAVYVAEVRPKQSAYERVLISLDQESCLPLQIQFFEPGKPRPRKELTTDPRSNVKHGTVWVAHSALMRDLQNLTTTHLMVDSHEQEQLLPGGQFTVEALEQAVREAK